jgi:biopolymer transport protein TolR
MAGSSSGGMRSSRGRRAMADINVVPYIDVMLVLLIIFMVAAPLTTPGVIDLPSVSKSSQAKENPVTVIVNADKTVKIRDGSGNERTVQIAEVAGVVQQMMGSNDQRPVVISGDKKVEYDVIMQIMDGLRKQGVARVGLSVQPRNS